MPRQPIVFQGFSLGEYGTLPSWEAGFTLYRHRLIYRGAWTGRDMVRSIGGALTPRVDFSTYNLTGIGAGPAAYCGPGASDTAGNAVVWAVNGAAVFAFDPRTPPATAQAVTPYTGAMPTPTNKDGYINAATKTWIAVGGANKIVRLDHVAHTVTTFAGPAGGGVSGICVLYGGRMLFVDYLKSNRVWYSAPNDPSDWSGTWSGGPGAGLNYFDVGDDTPISGLYPQRGHLSIAKPGLSREGEWWVLTGVPGVNDSLRQVHSGPAPAVNVNTTLLANGCVLNSGDIAFLSGSFYSPATYPGVFNGSHSTENRHLPFGQGPSVCHAFPLRGPGDWFMIVALPEGGGGIYLVKDGVPQLLTLPVLPFGVASFPEQDYHVFWENGTSFRVMSFYSDSPIPADGGVGYRGTAGKTGTFTLPEFREYGDGEMALRGVYVDFFTYAGMPAGNNTFNLTYTPRRVLTVGDGIPQTFNYSQPQPAATQRQRIFVPFFEVFGNGFQISVNTIRGVAIERIEAVYDQRAGQGA